MSPELQELLSAYPQVNTAVAYVELCYSDEPDQPIWSMMLKLVNSGRWSIDDVLKELRDSAIEERDSGSQGKWQQCVAEMELPQFRTYIMGKLGAV